MCSLTHTLTRDCEVGGIQEKKVNSAGGKEPRWGDGVCAVQLQVARWFARTMGVMLMCVPAVNRGTLALCLSVSYYQCH